MGDGECAICLSEEAGEEWVALNGCTHSFHEKCVLEISFRGFSPCILCPLCRRTSGCYSLVGKRGEETRAERGEGSKNRRKLPDSILEGVDKKLLVVRSSGSLPSSFDLHENVGIFSFSASRDEVSTFEWGKRTRREDMSELARRWFRRQDKRPSLPIASKLALELSGEESFSVSCELHVWVDGEGEEEEKRYHVITTCSRN